MTKRTDKGGKLSFRLVVCLFRRTKSDVCAEDSKTLQHTSVLLHKARHVAASYPFHCLIIFPLSVENGKSLQNFYHFLYLYLLSWDYEQLDYPDFESQQGQEMYLFSQGPDRLRAHQTSYTTSTRSSISGVRRPYLEAKTTVHIYAIMPCIRKILPFTIYLHAVATNICKTLYPLLLKNLASPVPYSQ